MSRFFSRAGRRAAALLSAMMLFTLSSSIPTRAAETPLSLKTLDSFDAVTKPTIINSIDHVWRTASNVSVAKINAAALVNSTVLSIPFSGVAYQAQRTSLQQSANGAFTWIGRITGGDRAAIFASAKGYTTGLIDGGNGLVTVTSAGTSGYSIVANVDPKKLPPDHPPAFREVEQRSPGTLERATQALSAASHADMPTEGYTERILVAYTRAVATANPGIVSAIEALIASANIAYAKSGIHVKLVLADPDGLQVDFVEANAIQADLSSALVDKLLNCARASDKADLVVVIVTDQDYCGYSDNIIADTSTAFSVINYGCATTNYTLTHEVGHLQGARHTIDEDPDAPFAYGHGYEDAQGQWGDVMSNCALTGCTRENFFSNPSILYDGVPSGVANRSNNAQAINATAASISHFHNTLPNQSCPKLTHSG